MLITSKGNRAIEGNGKLWISPMEAFKINSIRSQQWWFHKRPKQGPPKALAGTGGFKLTKKGN